MYPGQIHRLGLQVAKKKKKKRAGAVHLIKYYKPI